MNDPPNSIAVIASLMYFSFSVVGREHARLPPCAFEVEPQIEHAKRPAAGDVVIGIAECWGSTITEMGSNALKIFALVWSCTVWSQIGIGYAVTGAEQELDRHLLLAA